MITASRRTTRGFPPAARIARLRGRMSVVSADRRRRPATELEPLDVHKDTRPLSQTSDPTCPRCGYSLRDLPVPGSCPECGLSYDKDVLSAPLRVPRLGWALVLVPLLGFIAALPLLSLGLPIGGVAGLFLIAWFLYVNKRISAWRYDLRIQGFRQGTCPKPSPKYRGNLEHLLLAFDLLALFGLWWLGGPLFESL